MIILSNRVTDELNQYDIQPTLEIEIECLIINI